MVIKTRTTAVLLGLVLICGGFLAGIKLQQVYGTAAAAAPVAQTPRQLPAATPPVSGKVKLIDGTTVYLETADGRLLTVKTSETTTVAAQIGRAHV